MFFLFVLIRVFSANIFNLLQPSHPFKLRAEKYPTIVKNRSRTMVDQAFIFNEEDFPFIEKWQCLINHDSVTSSRRLSAISGFRIRS